MIMILANAIRGFATAITAIATMVCFAGFVFLIINEIVYYIKRRW